ncbi:mannitol-1-phosphate 5-dehydrogenase [Marinilactibacillus kalidii]|uniref:mannitol-1-phosphate 5-dehydrogenase n=1 Tax=Marinilactibacillus kalidii TaxID=2820274 RepID=UPI001ABDF30B|nr:mannitol-1-phosphate 5-dehydrogenase [Marinilactibacillus kalidii]
MLTVHFGAGNIGRGFIGEVLNQNQSRIAFVDVNKVVIDALNEQKEYTIEEASEENRIIRVNNVYGINNAEHPEEVVEALTTADLITTAIGPNILPHIAPLIAEGIEQRRVNDNKTPIDVVACENMIGGSTFLKEEVLKHVSNEETRSYIEKYVGFPDAAVDRIVPQQTHEDPLKVTVEPYKEWVISAEQSKNDKLKLESVKYVADLEPYIERKLFTVNTGHATVAYNGAYAGYETIDESLKDEQILAEVKNVLRETGALLVDKWQFDSEEHEAYIEKIISRFENPRLSDGVTRVGRTPIRKLGYDERFIRLIREAFERDLSVDHLVKTVSKVLYYNDPADTESVALQARLKNEETKNVISEITGLQSDLLLDKILETYNLLERK